MNRLLEVAGYAAVVVVLALAVLFGAMVVIFALAGA